MTTERKKSPHPVCDEECGPSRTEIPFCQDFDEANSFVFTPKDFGAYEEAECHKRHMTI